MVERGTKIRVLIAKFKLDSHDRGVRYVVKKLRESGMEVILINYLDVKEVLNTAMQEGIEAICLSYLSGGADHDVPLILQLLKDEGLEYVPVILGGFMPMKRVSQLLEAGVSRYYGPGSDLDELVDFINGCVTSGAS